MENNTHNFLDEPGPYLLPLKILIAGICFLLSATAIAIWYPMPPLKPLPSVKGKYTVHIGTINHNRAYQTDSWSRKDGMITFINKSTGQKMTATTCNVPFVENNYFEPEIPGGKN